ncbi:MAG: ArsA family ATPase [Acidimicrobiales bacterium]
MTRILLFTGKGGVGKTTTAAATAVHAARKGVRTLVLSTDPAHSLADAVGLPIGTEPTELGDHLHGQQLDATERMEESWSEIRSWLVEVFDWAGADAVEAEELSVVPGLDEVFALADLKRFATSGEWDLLVVDCAPTAETIRLLSLPDVLAWYMDRVFPTTRRLARLVGPVLQRVGRLPVAGDEVFGATARLYERLDGAKELLTDADRASVRLVVNAEAMVIAEARRTHTYLSLFGYHVDAVVLNRLLPDELTDPWFDRWRELQALHRDEIESGFAPLPVLPARLAGDELVGIDALGGFADRLYDGIDPLAVLHRGTPLRIARAGADAWVLEIDLPFADRGELDVARHGAELLVRVGPYRRAVALPDSLRRRTITSAALRDGTLRVAFGPKAGGRGSSDEGAADPEGT